MSGWVGHGCPRPPLFGPYWVGGERHPSIQRDSATLASLGINFRALSGLINLNVLCSMEGQTWQKSIDLLLGHSEHIHTNWNLGLNSSLERERESSIQLTNHIWTTHLDWCLFFHFVWTEETLILSWRYAKMFPSVATWMNGYFELLLRYAAKSPKIIW